MIGHVASVGSCSAGNRPGLQPSPRVDDQGLCCTSIVPIQGLAAVPYPPAAHALVQRVIGLCCSTTGSGMYMPEGLFFAFMLGEVREAASAMVNDLDAC